MPQLQYAYKSIPVEPFPIIVWHLIFCKSGVTKNPNKQKQKVSRIDFQFVFCYFQLLIRSEKSSLTFMPEQTLLIFMTE